jgi:hypothetical protein
MALEPWNLILFNGCISFFLSFFYSFPRMRRVIWNYCKCLFLKQLSSFNYSFKSHIVLTANVVCLMSLIFSLVGLLDPACSCVEGELFIFNISCWENQLNTSLSIFLEGYLFNPSSCCLLHWGWAQCTSFSWSSAATHTHTQDFHNVLTPSGLWKLIFCPCRASIKWIGPPLVTPEGLCPLWAASLQCFAVSGIASSAFPSLFWTPPGLHCLTLDCSGFWKIWSASKGFAARGVKPLLGTKLLSWHSQVMLSVPAPNQPYSTQNTKLFSRNSCFVPFI